MMVGSTGEVADTDILDGLDGGVEGGDTGFLFHFLNNPAGRPNILILVKTVKLGVTSFQESLLGKSLERNVKDFVAGAAESPEVGNLSKLVLNRLSHYTFLSRPL